MPTYSVLPSDLDIVVLKGDEFAATVDFDVDVTGYTFTSKVFETTRTVNSSFPGGLNTEGTTAQNITVTVDDAANGTLSLGLTETQTSSLSEATSYRWYLRGVEPGDVTRTYVSGAFSVRAP